MAGANNKAHLHYDGDHRQVLLYQVFGEKRVTLFHPDAGYKLMPLDGPFFCAGGIFFDKLSDDERLRVVDDANGFTGTLFPGDTLYMPLLFWHHLDYLTDAMSFNIRFGRNKYGRFLCPDNFHRDNYIQIFGSRLGGQTTRIPESLQRGFDSLVACYLESAPSLREKVRAIRGTLRDLCREFCPDAQVDKLCTAGREEALLDEIIRDIGSLTPYSPLDFIRSSRLFGPITSAQKRQIEVKAAASGYSQWMLGRILFNRLGKRSVDGLTRTEAAIFLSYLQSPGASLN
jgi:Cupin-like domain